MRMYKKRLNHYINQLLKQKNNILYNKLLQNVVLVSQNFI